MTELMVLLLTFLAGVGLPLQAIINARLGGVLGVPLGATLVNFGVGTLVIAGVLLALPVAAVIAVLLRHAHAFVTG